MQTSPIMPGLQRIFVSHCHDDEEFVRQLVKDLTQVLVDVKDAVWCDLAGGLQPGDAWWRVIREELTVRPIFIVVLSEAALHSRWVNDEIDLAWIQKNSEVGKRIIPLLYGRCDVLTRRPDLYSYLHKGEYIDFLSSPYEVAFSELLGRLGISLSEESRAALHLPQDSFRSNAIRLKPQIEVDFDHQNWPGIIEKTTRLIAEDPTAMTSALYRMRGWALFNTGELKPAQEAFDDGLALVRNAEERFLLLEDTAAILLTKKLWDDVLLGAREALLLAPGNPLWQSMLHLARQESQKILRGGANTTTGDILHPEDLLRILRTYRSGRRFYLHPTLVESLLTSARLQCGIPDGEQVLGLVDCTPHGQGKEWMAFGTTGLYFYHRLATPDRGKIAYTDFPLCTFTRQNHAFVDTGIGIRLCERNSGVPSKQLCELLNALKNLFEDYLKANTAKAKEGILLKGARDLHS